MSCISTAFGQDPWHVASDGDRAMWSEPLKIGLRMRALGATTRPAIRREAPGEGPTGVAMGPVLRFMNAIRRDLRKPGVLERRAG